jgi:hypothetical protein
LPGTTECVHSAGHHRSRPFAAVADDYQRQAVYWLARQDSNLRHSGSKPGVLPLNYVPEVVDRARAEPATHRPSTDASGSLTYRSARGLAPARTAAMAAVPR